MRICLGCDHAALELKNHIKDHLTAQGYDVLDVGTFTAESVHYPIYGEKVALEVVSGRADRGILLCGTGLGISMAASKVPGTRVAVCTDTYMARMTREHNDANILALGARVVGEGLAEDIVDSFLTTSFLGGRHGLRVDMLKALDEKSRSAP